MEKVTAKKKAAASTPSPKKSAKEILKQRAFKKTAVKTKVDKSKPVGSFFYNETVSVDWGGFGEVMYEGEVQKLYPAKKGQYSVTGSYDVLLDDGTVGGVKKRWIEHA
ncbi:hypothetical protein TrLO_g253 [Triparma laevis f. longispina]|uniref:Uncharacterized protein n=1 Tax=Triparma laevis f. longispina TaxID=1714387 RepID=A0A9W7F592_9STRA|nr:hypothetical protein TrLO_g253 [Triparma laevis f. longispina]